MVKINGKEMQCDGMTLAEYLASADYDTRRIAAEINGEIIPKAQYDSVVLQEGDVVEIVSFVGGG